MMDFVTTLHLEEPQKTVQARIEHFFDLQGYKARRDHNNEIYYERGSAMGNYVALGPRSWHAFAYVTLYPINDQTMSMDVRLKVDTQGQIVLDRERQYWQAEFDVLTAYLETGKSKKGNLLQNLDTRNSIQNIALTFGLFILGMGAAVGAAIVMLHLIARVKLG